MIGSVGLRPDTRWSGAIVACVPRRRKHAECFPGNEVVFVADSSDHQNPGSTGSRYLATPGIEAARAWIRQGYSPEMEALARCRFPVTRGTAKERQAPASFGLCRDRMCVMRAVLNGMRRE